MWVHWSSDCAFLSRGSKVTSFPSTISIILSWDLPYHTPPSPPQNYDDDELRKAGTKMSYGLYNDQKYTKELYRQLRLTRN